jgi:hypothetical protein
MCLHASLRDRYLYYRLLSDGLPMACPFDPKKG